MKNHLIPVLSLSVFLACTAEKESYQTIEGKTMGTYYRVTYAGSSSAQLKQTVDSLLLAVNQEISTYEKNSTISHFNKADTIFDTGLDLAGYEKCAAYPQNCGGLTNRHFYANYLAAKFAYERTGGAFDPTVQPLVNYWGFGNKGHEAVEKIDSHAVDSLRQFVGFEKISVEVSEGKVRLRKAVPGIQLDFGGTGQGYGIDVVGDLLEQRSIANYLVDIGGECRARGVNPEGQAWTIGINTPKQEAAPTEFTRLVRLENLSVSTSGNYRNIREVNGQKYSHFIDPLTGFPQKSNLLSVSVFSKDCLTADALATGFMVMGLEKAFELANHLNDIEALFIFSDDKGKLQIKYTPGTAQLLLDK